MNNDKSLCGVEIGDNVIFRTAIELLLRQNVCNDNAVSNTSLSDDIKNFIESITHNWINMDCVKCGAGENSLPAEQSKKPPQTICCLGGKHNCIANVNDGYCAASTSICQYKVRIS